MKPKQNYLSIIFVAVVIVGVISGSMAFFAPAVKTMDSESPTGFFFSFFNFGEEPIAADAGSDQVVQVDSNVVLNSYNSKGRITYYSWEIKEPDGAIDAKIGRRTSFVPEKAGNYIVTLKVYSGKESKTDNLTITALPKLDFKNYQSNLKTLQAEERASRTTAGKINKPPVAKILLIYPNPADEEGTIRFLAYAYDPDGEVKYYYWYAGRKFISKEKSFLATKISPGTYDFTLFVRDDKGPLAYTTERVIVKPIGRLKITPPTSSGISLWEVE